jgi:hypothetical protein
VSPARSTPDSWSRASRAARVRIATPIRESRNRFARFRRQLLGGRARDPEPPPRDGVMDRYRLAGSAKRNQPRPARLSRAGHPWRAFLPEAEVQFREGNHVGCREVESGSDRLLTTARRGIRHGALVVLVEWVFRACVLAPIAMPSSEVRFAGRA